MMATSYPKIQSRAISMTMLMLIIIISQYVQGSVKTGERDYSQIRQQIQRVKPIATTVTTRIVTQRFVEPIMTTTGHKNIKKENIQMDDSNIKSVSQQGINSDIFTDDQTKLHKEILFESSSKSFNESNKKVKSEKIEIITPSPTSSDDHGSKNEDGEPIKFHEIKEEAISSSVKKESSNVSKSGINFGNLEPIQNGDFIDNDNQAMTSQHSTLLSSEESSFSSKFEQHKQSHYKIVSSSSELSPTIKELLLNQSQTGTHGIKSDSMILLNTDDDINVKHIGHDVKDSQESLNQAQIGIQGTKSDSMKLNTDHVDVKPIDHVKDCKKFLNQAQIGTRETKSDSMTLNTGDIDVEHIIGQAKNSQESLNQAQIGIQGTKSDLMKSNTDHVDVKHIGHVKDSKKSLNQAQIGIQGTKSDSMKLDTGDIDVEHIGHVKDSKKSLNHAQIGIQGTKSDSTSLNSDDIDAEHIGHVKDSKESFQAQIGIGGTKINSMTLNTDDIDVEHIGHVKNSKKSLNQAQIGIQGTKSDSMKLNKDHVDVKHIGHVKDSKKLLNQAQIGIQGTESESMTLNTSDIDVEHIGQAKNSQEPLNQAQIGHQGTKSDLMKLNKDHVDVKHIGHVKDSKKSLNHAQIGIQGTKSDSMTLNFDDIDAEHIGHVKDSKESFQAQIGIQGTKSNSMTLNTDGIDIEHIGHVKNSKKSLNQAQIKTGETKSDSITLNTDDIDVKHIVHAKNSKSLNQAQIGIPGTKEDSMTLNTDKINVKHIGHIDDSKKLLNQAQSGTRGIKSDSMTLNTDNIPAKHIDRVKDPRKTINGQGEFAQITIDSTIAVDDWKKFDKTSINRDGSKVTKKQPPQTSDISGVKNLRSKDKNISIYAKQINVHESRGGGTTHALDSLKLGAATKTHGGDGKVNIKSQDLYLKDDSVSLTNIHRGNNSYRTITTKSPTTKNSMTVDKTMTTNPSIVNINTSIHEGLLGIINNVNITSKKSVSSSEDDDSNNKSVKTIYTGLDDEEDEDEGLEKNQQFEMIDNTDSSYLPIPDFHEPANGEVSNPSASLTTDKNIGEKVKSDNSVSVTATGKKRKKGRGKKKQKGKDKKTTPVSSSPDKNKKVSTTVINKDRQNKNIHPKDSYGYDYEDQGNHYEPTASVSINILNKQIQAGKMGKQSNTYKDSSTSNYDTINLAQSQRGGHASHDSSIEGHFYSSFPNSSPHSVSDVEGKTDSGFDAPDDSYYAFGQYLKLVKVERFKEGNVDVEKLYYTGIGSNGETINYTRTLRKMTRTIQYNVPSFVIGGTSDQGNSENIGDAAASHPNMIPFYYVGGNSGENGDINYGQTSSPINSGGSNFYVKANTDRSSYYPYLVQQSYDSNTKKIQGEEGNYPSNTYAHSQSVHKEDPVRRIPYNRNDNNYHVGGYTPRSTNYPYNDNKYHAQTDYRYVYVPENRESLALDKMVAQQNVGKGNRRHLTGFTRSIPINDYQHKYQYINRKASTASCGEKPCETPYFVKADQSDTRGIKNGGVLSSHLNSNNRDSTAKHIKNLRFKRSSTLLRLAARPTANFKPAAAGFSHFPTLNDPSGENIEFNPSYYPYSRSKILFRIRRHTNEDEESEYSYLDRSHTTSRSRQGHGIYNSPLFNKKLNPGQPILKKPSSHNNLNYRYGHPRSFLDRSEVTNENLNEWSYGLTRFNDNNYRSSPPEYSHGDEYLFTSSSPITKNPNLKSTRPTTKSHSGKSTHQMIKSSHTTTMSPHTPKQSITTTKKMNNRPSNSDKNYVELLKRDLLKGIPCGILGEENLSVARSSELDRNDLGRAYPIPHSPLNEGLLTPEPDDIPRPRIVGGEETVAGTWPWFVTIRYMGEHKCAGTIIGHNHILTATHCFPPYAEVKNFTVIAGTHYKTGVIPMLDQERRIAKLSLHPHFDRENKFDNDIALIRIDQPFIMNQYVQPVCLPDKHEKIPFASNPGHKCCVAGYGDTKGTTPEVALNQLCMPILPTKTCNSTEFYKGRLTSTMMCAGFEEGGKDACKGDSGGPFVCDTKGLYKLVGIVSWGEGCARAKRPGLYTNVSMFHEWIFKNL